MITKKHVWLLALLLLLLVGCADDETPTPTAGESAIATPTATPLPEITIVERDQVMVGVDTAFPPLADLDADGYPVGIEVDLLEAVMTAAGLDYQLVSSDWESLFDDLVAGRFDAAIGGVTEAGAPADLVELTAPYLEIGEVAVTLADNETIRELADLGQAVVGVEPLSWGEFAITDPGADQVVPAGRIRRFDSSTELIQALFDGYVDAIVTHHTVIESYMRVNPGYLRVLGGEGSDAWLTTHQFRIALPKGADELLAQLDGAVATIFEDGRVEEIVAGWGMMPEFAERPRFVQDPGAGTLVAGIEKVDEQTVRFVLNRPDPFFDYKLAVPAMALHSPANLEQYSGGGELSLNPVGTGPYTLEGWEPGVALTLTANLDYWGTPAAIERIRVEPEPDAGLRFDRLRGNQAELAEGLSKEDLDELDDNPITAIEVSNRTPINVAYLGMNRDVAPFDDRNVRLAVAMCMDQPDLVETVYPTGTLIASQFLPANTFGFSPGLLWHDTDPEGAADLLAAAGYEDGLSLTLSLSSSPSDFIPDPTLVADAVIEQLDACGIQAEVQLLAPVDFERQLVAGELPFHLAGWSADFPGPIGFMNTHFMGLGNGQQFGAPFPEIVDLLSLAGETADTEQRRDLYNQVNQLLWEKVIFVPLAHGGSSLAARSTVPGVSASPVRQDLLAALGPISSTATITTVTFLRPADPLSLDPTDEVDDDTFAITSQIFETLTTFEPATTVLTQSLAIEWQANETADVWEFTLRPDVHFQDGAPLDADAVILNFERQWIINDPLHTGRTGAFRYFEALFGGFIREQN